MKCSIIEKIRNTSRDERPALLNRIYEKNIQFFKDRYPDVHSFLEQVQCPYEINITDAFLDIVNPVTQERSTITTTLDTFAEYLGGWSHEEWVDLVNVTFYRNKAYPLHYKIFSDFIEKMTHAFPEYKKRVLERKIYLKQDCDDDSTRFSPPVIFLGIFHGLHIDYYLSRTRLTRMLLIEPEIERFEVSCYFLDYEAIYDNFGTLFLAIGPDSESEVIKNFIHFDFVTPQVWTRVLSGYPGKYSKSFIDSIKVLQESASKIFYPLDVELEGIKNTIKNLDRGLSILTETKKISPQSRIVIVAAGPSLDDDIKWLAKNSTKLIIFAVHSAVSVLRKAGIKPDFQLSMETQPEHLCAGNYNLELYDDVPLIVYCRVDSSWVVDENSTLLVNENEKAQAVQFVSILTNTHPSTTNMAISLGCCLKPAEIYLVGCDFGYKDINRSHASGSWHSKYYKDKKIKQQVSPDGLVPVSPNFAGSHIMSNHFLLQTRLSAEKSFQKNDSKVVNVSDGAFIKGAKPERSRNIHLSHYKGKQKDVELVRMSFSRAEEGINYLVYPASGKALLKDYLDTIEKVLTMKDFDWVHFSGSLDTILDKSTSRFFEDKKDWRMDIYGRLLSDILRYWYSVLMFTESQEEADYVYKAGLKVFKESIGRIGWPDNI